MSVDDFITQRPHERTFPPRDVLIVDDDNRNLMAIEAALGDLGGRLVKARSGVEALRCLLERDFALILLDVMMPSMNGFETARLIRSRARSQHVPIIFVTAYEHSSEQILEGYALGAVDFLFKPVVPEVLRAKASVFVALQERTAEVLEQARLLQEADRREHEQRLDEERRGWEGAALKRQAAQQEKSAAELARMNEQLAQMNARLSEADRRKDEFLATLAHELRNPLAPLHSCIELLREPNANVGRLRGTMKRQVEHITRLVDDLLEVARISTGAIDLRMERTDLRSVLAQAVETSLIMSDRRELVSTWPDEPLILDADPVRLAQVVSNLLNNAVHHSPPDGHIELRAEREGDQLAVSVIDEGCGIPEHEQGRIFEPFVKREPGSGGLGIGLTLVQRLTELHGGQVEVISAGDGQGTTFVVRLPADTNLGAQAVQVPPSSRPGPATRGPLRVVVVDDSIDIRESLAELLRLWGHEVALAGDGISGAALVVERCPDVAIIDLGLPQLDGYGVARRVRSAALARPPRLIALTGMGRDSDRRRALAAGFDEHVVKPPDPATLRKMLALDPSHA